MINKIRDQNVSHKAFTLIEMMIVLIVMWIMLMVTLYLSWDQIQKVRDKTVKESILAEMQSRYSRNRWSSSFAWIMYDTLNITLGTWKNKIDFNYIANGVTGVENTFMDNFVIRGIYPNYDFVSTLEPSLETVNINYNPYKIYCVIWEDDKFNNIIIITKVNESKDYCFEIKQKNCRLIEVSEEKCINLKNKANLK